MLSLRAPPVSSTHLSSLCHGRATVLICRRPCARASGQPSHAVVRGHDCAALGTAEKQCAVTRAGGDRVSRGSGEVADFAADGTERDLCGGRDVDATPRTGALLEELWFRSEPAVVGVAV